MSPKPKPRRIQVDGADLVVLTSAAYKILDGARRQVGAQSARIRVLRDHIEELDAFLDELEQVVVGLPPCVPAPCSACGRESVDCVRKSLAAALTRRPRQGGRRPS